MCLKWLKMRIKSVFYSLDVALQRAIRGWCYADASHISYFLHEILPDMLEYRANDYPYYPALLDEDKWRETLLKMRRNILMCDEDFAEKMYRKKYSIPEEQPLSPYESEKIWQATEKAKERFCELFRQNFFRL